MIHHSKSGKSSGVGGSLHPLCYRERMCYDFATKNHAIQAFKVATDATTGATALLLPARTLHNYRVDEGPNAARKRARDTMAPLNHKTNHPRTH
jgi:hypothetical protein